MKTLITACVVVAVMALFVGAAQAHCGGYGYVQPHYHWHDTSHWDYQPGYFINHGCHQHYVPGQWYFHQTGHYDLHY